MGTKFSEVYNRFLGKITDDLYVVYTPQDTMKDTKNLLIDALPGFEFPRCNLYSYALNLEEKSIDEVTNTDFYFPLPENPERVMVDNSSFEADLTTEEINILAILMMNGWLQRQITSIENIRMKYSGNDFKMTSQANHLSKLLTLQTECQRQSHHMQRLYKRRRFDDEGKYEPNWSFVREISALDN